MLSLGIASMLFTSLFLWIARDRVLPKFRMAVMVSATVTSIAAYHYFRMFDSFNAAYPVGGDVVAGFNGYNVGYRYVDWILTVPLLLVELVAVMGLARAVQTSLLTRMVTASPTSQPSVYSVCSSSQSLESSRPKKARSLLLRNFATSSKNKK